MDEEHPTELELVTWLDAGEADRASLGVDVHLRGCALCRTLVASAGRPIATPRPVPFEPQESFEVPKSREAPSPGEVWRLAWDAVSELGLVWRSVDGYFSVVPVRPDAGFADDRTVVVDSHAAILSGTLALWFGLESSVPLAVFDRYWFDVDPEPLAAIRARVRERKPIESAEFTMGTPIIDALDDRYEYREQLTDHFEALATSHWWTETSQSRRLSDLVEASSADWKAVTSALGMEPHERLRLQRSQRLLTDEDASRLAPLLGTTPSAVLATNPPVPLELANVLDRPRWKSRILERRLASGIDEATTRYQVAVAALALAARETVPASTEEQWDVRLEHVFAP
jgi:hypothetical protein